MVPYVHALLAVLLFSSTTKGANVLLMPWTTQSHLIYFSRLAALLSDEGHVTSLLVPSNAKPPTAMLQTVEIVTFEVPDKVPYTNTPECSALMMEAAFQESFMQKMNVFKEIAYGVNAEVTEECHYLFQNKPVIEKLMEAKYDLVIVDLALMVCSYALPYKMGVQHASFAVPYSMWLLRVPALPSFVPATMGESSDRMSFLERLNNAYVEGLTFAFTNRTDYFIRKYVPEKPVITPQEVMQRSSLFFLLKDNVVSYPSPSMPNVIDIGDIMARPAQQLPEDLQLYMDASRNGVILVSFGSFVDHLPAKIMCKLAEAFSRLSQSVIWRMKQDLLQCELSPNVKPMIWLPQNDILAHPNMKLFISHCGINSVIEAVNHAVPLLALPVTLDQPFNAEVVRSHGYGLKLDFKNLTSEQLADNVKTIIADGTFKERITRASQILKDKPMSGGKRASFWINHVVKYGPDHLRTKAFELTDAQFFMLDIVAFVVAVIFTLGVFLMCCMWIVCKMCCSKCCGKGTKSTLKTKFD